MKRFAALFATLDSSPDTADRVAALADYFRNAPEADRIWAVALFSGRRPRRAIAASELPALAAEWAGIPPWLFDESRAVTGDLIETIALILPPAKPAPGCSLSDWIGVIRQLKAQDSGTRKAGIKAAWDAQTIPERIVFTKLLTGGFRGRANQQTVIRAVAQATGRPVADISSRLIGAWSPDTVTWADLIDAPDATADLSRPYPFHGAAMVESLARIGALEFWRAEYSWDGLPIQVIRRGGIHAIWSRGDDLMTDKFPELAQACDWLPDGTVIEGLAVAYRDGAPLPFGALEARIGRASVARKALAETPVVLMAHDLLEEGGTDIRARPFDTRRARLEALMANMPATAPVRLSPLVDFDGVPALEAARGAARTIGATGLMLKRADSPYRTERDGRSWLEWKTEPLTIDAVLIYAQQGQTHRDDGIAEFTFAVRDTFADGALAHVPIAKAGSGLTDAEFGKISDWVRRNTVQKFGPVRQVPPELVFEIAFDGIAASTRHKSGVVLRSARISRWRMGQAESEINTMDDLRQMLARYGQGVS